MDNLQNTNTDNFIQEKSLELFNSLNQLDLKKEEVEITKFRLSGNSNLIFRVEIKYTDGTFNTNTNCSKIKIDKIFFKIFGHISALVDRDLETHIMQKLNELGVSPKIYETDMKTYRVEEYIDNCTCLQRESMLNEEVYQKVTNIFCSISSLGDFKYYFDYIGNTNKTVFFDKLKSDSKTNLINFTIEKMRPLAEEKSMEFRKKYLADEEHLRPSHIMRNKLEQLCFLIEQLEVLFYDVCPEKGIIVLNHNDTHPLNILLDQNKKLFLCDFEYSTYNFLGFDICNYLVESLFLVEAQSFPFYQNFSTTNCSELLDEKYYQIYLNFFDTFEKQNGSLFADFKEYKSIIETCRTKDYYLRLVGMSSLLWFAFAIIYLDYDTSKAKNSFDYFNFALDRASIYFEVVGKNIKK